MKRDEVVRILSSQKKVLVERYHVVSLSLFGSVARDEARPDSDIDLLVKFAVPTGVFEFLDLKAHLEALFGCKVDIGRQRSLRPQYRVQVWREAVRVF